MLERRGAEIGASWSTSCWREVSTEVGAGCFVLQSAGMHTEWACLWGGFGELPSAGGCRVAISQVV